MLAEKQRLLKAKLPAMVKFKKIAALNVIIARIEKDELR